MRLKRMAIFQTALRYFMVIFALAFTLGVARNLVIAPGIGAGPAVTLEVVVLLAASWLAARYLIRGSAFDTLDLAIIGGLAFALTMISEAVLANLIQGQTLDQWAADVVSPVGLIGLVGQLGFAGMPVVAAAVRRRVAAH